MTLDLTTTGPLADALKAHPSATALLVMVGNHVYEMAEAELTAYGLVLRLKAAGAPSVAETVQAANAELTEPTPIVPRRTGKSA